MPVPCTNSFREKRLSILASCMTNLSKFHIVFYSSALIRLNKDACEGHLCQTVNNFVKQNKSSLMSPLRKRRPPQLIRHIRNTRVSCIPTFDESCSSTLHPLNIITVVLLVWVPDSGAILHKRANRRKVSSFVQLLWASLRVATQKNNGLELALFVMVAICFDHSKSLLRVTPKYLASMTSSSLGSRVRDTRIMLHLTALKRILHVVLPQFSSKFRSFCRVIWSCRLLLFL